MKKCLLILACIASQFSLVAQTDIWWSEAKILNTNDDFGYHRPRVVLTSDGFPVVLWNNTHDAYVSKWTGNGFSTPLKVSHASIAGDFWMGPDIASKGDTIYVVYKEVPESSSDKHIFCRSSFDGGLTFNDPVQVDDLGQDFLTRFSTVAIDNNGNPVVAYMRFTSSYTQHDWVISKSTDLGLSFSAPVKASSDFGNDAEGCDCCPGQLVIDGDTYTMLYRNNNNNIRDIYAGISKDGGLTFNQQMNVDKSNWMINSCPASGPDGFIIGDTLYSTFFTAGTGKNRTFYNKSSINSATGSTGIRLTEDVTDLTSQNYPRITSNGKYYAAAWMQTIRPRPQIAFSFVDDIHQPLTKEFTTLEVTSSGSLDLAMSDDKIYLVWQDNIDKKLKYKVGHIGQVGIENHTIEHLSIYPNPVRDNVMIKLPISAENTEVEIIDISGKQILNQQFSEQLKGAVLQIPIGNVPDGAYIINVKSDGYSLQHKLIKKADQ